MRSGSATGWVAVALAGTLTALLGDIASGAASPGASPAATPLPPGAWFLALEPGACFTEGLTDDGGVDYAAPPGVVPCDQPHRNEVVALVSMGEGDYPEGDLAPVVMELCAPAWEAFLGRPHDEAMMGIRLFWPDLAEWQGGAHDVVCAVHSEEPITGTARSGSLRAPGERIAVYHEVAGVGDIWLVDAGDGSMRNMTGGQLSEVLDIPSWRPDGSRVAITAEESPGDTGIFEVPEAGGEPIPLLTGPGPQNGPAISPDGVRVAFISDVHGAEYDVYVSDLSTGTTTRLTTHADRDSSPEWSPDGESIAFRRRDAGVSDIWVMGSDGTDPVQLTRGTGSNFGPRWSPDGSSILFSSDRSGNFDVWVMDADGGNQRQLTTHPADDDFPAWSSDGAFIAFQSGRYLGHTLWLMRSDGSDQTELAGVGAIGWARFAPRPVE